LKKERNIRLGSLFDGIGGFPYAASFYGIEPVWASEIMPQAVSVTKRHFHNMEHVGDITKLDGGVLPPVDIITFGSPCQDLSTAGKRAGMDGARSSLFYEAIRIIDEMRRATDGKYPRYALWENVPGAFSSGGGHDFQAVLEAFTKSKVPMPGSGRWANAGMVRSGGASVAWRVLNAQHHGVPQRRRRIFLICDFGGESAGEILFVEEGLRGHIAPCRQARQGTAAPAEGGTGSASRGANIEDIAATLVAGYGNHWNGNAGAYDGANFALSPMGDITAFACNQRDEVRNLHNVSAAVCAHPSVKQQTFIAENCLNPWDAQQARVFMEDGTAPTLAGADGGGGRNPGGLVFCAISAKSNTGVSEELAGTLTCMHEQPFLCIPKLARTLTARGDSSPCADRGQNIVAVGVPAITMRMREGCDGGGKGPLLQEEMSAALATRGDQYLFAPSALGVHQGQDGQVQTAESAYSLTTSGNASGRNAPLIAQASGVTAKGNGDCFLLPECHSTLSSGGGQAGQGYPAVLVAHPDISGTPCASGAGLSRPAGMASEPDLCIAYALQGNMIGRREENGSKGSGIRENLSFTLTATDTPAVAAREPIPIHDRATRFQGGGSTRSGDGSGNGLGIGKPGDPAPTLTSGDHHSVAAVFNRQRSDLFTQQDIACSQCARQHKDATDLVCDVSAVDCRNYKEVGDVSGTLQAKDKPGYSLNYQNPVRAGYIVRRLTPTECERLQGFPDGWTRFGADDKEISDTRRYQMLGNSVAVPCVAYIMSGVAAQIYFSDKEAAA